MDELERKVEELEGRLHIADAWNNVLKSDLSDTRKKLQIMTTLSDITVGISMVLATALIFMIKRIK